MSAKKGGRRNPVAAFFGFGLENPAPKKGQTGSKASRKTVPQPKAEDQGGPVAAHSFSGHFITFAIVFVIIALAVSGPLTSFIRQQNEIADARANIAALEAQQRELQAQVSWWEDDNYVKQQARSRLFYVEPGQTPYLVVGLDAASELADDTSAAAKTAPEESWTAKLWGSMQLAAEPTDPPSTCEAVDPATSATATPSGTAEPTATGSPSATPSC